MAQCREGTARSGSVLRAHRVDQGSTAGSGLGSQGCGCTALKEGSLQEHDSSGGDSGLERRHRQSWLYGNGGQGNEHARGSRDRRQWRAGHMCRWAKALAMEWLTAVVQGTGGLKAGEGLEKKFEWDENEPPPPPPPFL